MSPIKPARGPVQLQSYQIADFRAGTGIQIGSAYMLNGIGVALVEESPNEIQAPAVEETILIVSLNNRTNQHADLLGKKLHQPFKRNSLMVIPPGLATWWAAPHTSMQQLHIHIQPSFLQRMDETNLQNLDRPRFAFEDDILTNLNATIRAALLAYQGTGAELYLEHLLLAYTLRTFSPKLVPTATSKGGLSPWAERQAIAYMMDNLASKIQLADLAEIAGLSPHHFARMFKQTTGVAPYAYLMRARMQKACQLLAHSDLPISEIADLVGYSAPSTFARLFKVEIGDSPLRYRQSMRQRPKSALWDEVK